MAESQDVWEARQAIELLAQHIPFERDLAVKAELIEELRALVLRKGRRIDRAQFGFEARLELQRLGLWDHFDDSTPPDAAPDDDVTYGHGRPPLTDDDLWQN
jgi:hypothetical protein